MSTVNQVWFVSAGMDKPKKRDHLLSRRQQYLNYGALTLATVLKSKGYLVKLVHGGHAKPKDFVDCLAKAGIFETKYPLLLSVPSFYALSWTQKFTKIIKHRSPKIRIVVGGRWVIGSDIGWLRTKLPFVDEVVPGLAEGKIGDVVSCNEVQTLDNVDLTGVPSFNLDHRLVSEFEKFQPSVEASRGCGMGCTFCEERDIPLTRLKDPKILVSHLQEVAVQYNDWSIRPYVQSSFFAPNLAWAEKMADATSQYGQSIAWRCETRVDSIRPTSVPALAQAGLKVIDLGLESASPQQILKMQKSPNPDRYLDSASKLINACKKNGIWVKVNFLLYAGETEKTYLETIAWLDDHADSIKGVSAGPVVVFGSPRTAGELISDINRNGGRLVNASSSDMNGIAQIHPSTEISNDDAEQLSLDASRRYMTKREYFDLKSFSYYPRQYTYQDFYTDIENCQEPNLPFRMSSARG